MNDFLEMTCQELAEYSGPGATAKPCILCGTPTTGSVGAAGIHWKNICQTCKDAEDRALEARLQQHGAASSTRDGPTLAIPLSRWRLKKSQI